jgi:hypothetical protein
MLASPVYQMIFGSHSKTSGRQKIPTIYTVLFALLVRLRVVLVTDAGFLISTRQEIGFCMGFGMIMRTAASDQTTQFISQIMTVPIPLTARSWTNHSLVQG